uniref:Uncharacterized protein n=1 Tax=Panagrolaimus sp. PS1159 TaxID=55785 RepID=A0AC35G9V5_9BILA
MPITPTSMPYYSDPTAAAYGAPPLTSTNDAIDRSNRSNNNISSNNNTFRVKGNARDIKIGTQKQTNFN